MFLITDYTQGTPCVSQFNDTKTAWDYIVGLTGSAEIADKVQAVIGQVQFGDEFACRPYIKVQCVEKYANLATCLTGAEKLDKDLRETIDAHNRMIETVENAGITCNLFRGMEVWHKIACEGAAITHAARSVGIDAKVNMQSGKIYVSDKYLQFCAMRNAVGALEPEDGLTLDEIIRNLEDQVEDRESLIDKDDPDCIFRRDAAALRAAAKLLREMRAKT